MSTSRSASPLLRHGGTSAVRLRLIVLVLVAAALLPAARSWAATPMLSVGDATVTEGDAGTRTASFTVSLAPAATGVVTVDFSTVNGTAVGPDDYGPDAGTLTFAPGESEKTIAITVQGDTLQEGTETFTVQLDNATGGAGISDATGVGTIDDDDAASSLSISDVVVREGQDAQFTVSLFPQSTQTVTVAYTTANGTAASPDDYDNRAGVLTFSPGQTTETITVPVRSDQLSEPEETFNVQLSNAANAQIADNTGKATVQDNDVFPSLSIDDVTVPEGQDARFTVSLFPKTSQTVTVALTTVNGTATAPDDYENKAQLLTFSPGDSQKTIAIKTHTGEATLDALQETFTVQLSNATNAQIVDPSGQATILDGDVTPSLSINDIEVLEGDSGTTEAKFTVFLFPKSDQRVTAQFATANATAVAPDDYENSAGTVEFSPGETTKQIVVPVVADKVDETPEDQRFFLAPGVLVNTQGVEETFTVNLFNAVNARVADAVGEASVIDDDLTPALTVSDVTVREGDSGTADTTFTVSLFPESQTTVRAEFATVNETAVAPEDYAFTSGTLEFGPGDRTKTITVPVNGDSLDELDETFALNVTTPQDGILVLDGKGIGTIADDDTGPALSIGDVTVVEGTSDAVFTLSLGQASNQVITADVGTVDDTAESPDDYDAFRGTVSFAPGQTSLTVQVPIVADRLEEPDETFLVRIFRAFSLETNLNFGIADDEAVGIIVDDDSPAAARVAVVPTPTDQGYWVAAEDGDVFPFGDAPYLGSLGLTHQGTPPVQPNQPIVGMAATPTGRGYWLVAADGGIFAFGNARFLGSTGDIRLNLPIVGMASTPSGLGYWLVAADGGIFAFGDARFFGSTGGIPLTRPIVAMAATPSGGGYWLVASDGGVFAFGDARFWGSRGGRPLNHPVVGMAAAPDGQGYWLTGGDGGIFAFGNAGFLGSTGGIRLVSPVRAMAPDRSGNGYWLVADDGGIFTFGDAKFFGSTGGVRPRPTSRPTS